VADADLVEPKASVQPLISSGCSLDGQTLVALCARALFEAARETKSPETEELGRK
jgi:hypothetical protein